MTNAHGTSKKRAELRFLLRKGSEYCPREHVSRKRAARQATPSSAAHLDLACRWGANCVAGIALAVLIVLQEDVFSVHESLALDE